MRPIKKDTEIKLALLLENADNKLRVVGYHAVAEVLASRLIEEVRKKDNLSVLDSIQATNTTLLATITNVVEYVNELSIIDRTLLDSTIRRYVSAKINSRDLIARRQEILSYTSVLDILGISGYYTIEDLKLIEDNINHYKVVAVATMDVLDCAFKPDKVGV